MTILLDMYYSPHNSLVAASKSLKTIRISAIPLIYIVQTIAGAKILRFTISFINERRVMI